jgi:transcription antitermination factor NusG
MSGPFVSFTGKIEGINQSKALLKVKVAIAGGIVLLRVVAVWHFRRQHEPYSR